MKFAKIATLSLAALVGSSQVTRAGFFETLDSVIDITINSAKITEAEYFCTGFTDQKAFVLTNSKGTKLTFQTSRGQKGYAAAPDHESGKKTATSYCGLNNPALPKGTSPTP
jgi:hypothetical protein